MRLNREEVVGMGDGTGIQWTDATWNPLRARRTMPPTNEALADEAIGWACVRVSSGCQNCYASTLNEDKRWGRGTGLPYTVPALAQVEHYLDEKTLTQPLRWKKARRVFVCSMTDLFGEWVTDDQLDHIFYTMAYGAPQHIYQVLTKRPERMREYLRDPQKLVDRWFIQPPRLKVRRSRPWPNIWLGVSVEDQARADERIPLLLDTPAAVRFLSCEPLLGPIEFSNVSGRSDAVQQLGRRALAGIDWVIVGGESGPGARPFDLAWARSLRDQCADAGVSYFFKQGGASNRCPHSGHGSHLDCVPTDLQVREWPHVA